MSSRKCRACSRAVTCRTAVTGKLSPPPARVAWPHWKWRNIWKRKGTELGLTLQALCLKVSGRRKSSLYSRRGLCFLVDCRIWIAGPHGFVINPEKRSSNQADRCDRPPDSCWLVGDFSKMMKQSTAKPTADQRPDSD